MAGEAAQQALAQAGAMLDNATSLVENAVQDALAGANEAIDQAREMLAGAGEQALRDALAEVRGPLDDAMGALGPVLDALPERSEEHTSELQSLMRISYAVFCLKKKN